MMKESFHVGIDFGCPEGSFTVRTILDHTGKIISQEFVDLPTKKYNNKSILTLKQFMKKVRK